MTAKQRRQKAITRNKVRKVKHQAQTLIDQARQTSNVTSGAADTLVTRAGNAMAIMDAFMVDVKEVIELHKGVAKTVKGAEKQMCPACKVVAPCATFANLNEGMAVAYNMLSNEKVMTAQLEAVPNLVVDRTKTPAAAMTLL